MEDMGIVPAGLPLVSDYVLVRMRIEYRQADQFLEYGQSHTAAEMRSNLRAALQAIEQEITARGLVPA